MIHDNVAVLADVPFQDIRGLDHLYASFERLNNS